MTFTLTIEREIVGNTVLDEFDGVEKYMDAPYNDRVHLQFADGSSEKITHGRIIHIEAES